MGQALGQAMRIKVTQAHIDKGQQVKAGRCFRCPVALAFHDAGYPKVSVTRVGIFPYGVEGLVRIPLSPEVEMFIWCADYHEEISPFEFDFTVPEEYINATQA